MFDWRRKFNEKFYNLRIPFRNNVQLIGISGNCIWRMFRLQRFSDFQVICTFGSSEMDVNIHYVQLLDVR